MEMKISFPGGLKVSAEFGGVTVTTDQPSETGENSSPTPFELFVASMGTCAGVFALSFLRRKGLSQEGVSMTLSAERDAQTHLLNRVKISIHTPPDFPEDYKPALVNSAALCLVARQMKNPPEITITTD